MAARRWSLGDWVLLAALVAFLALAVAFGLLAYAGRTFDGLALCGGLCGVPLLVFAGGLVVVSVAQHLAKRHLALEISPPTAAPGDEVRAVVQLRLTAAARVRSISVTLRGTEEAVLTDREAEQRERRVIVEEVRELLRPLPGGATHSLFPGTHQYQTTFRLPQDALPSYTGVTVVVEYEITAHVDRPRALDLVLDRTLRVIPKEGVPPAAKPEEDVESTLSGSVALALELLEEEVAGGRISGRVLVSNPEGRTIREVTVAFGCLERVSARGRSSRRFTPMTAAAFREPKGEALVFALDVPREVPAPFRGAISSVRFAVQAHANVALAGSASVTKTVRISGIGRTHRPDRAPPTP